MIKIKLIFILGISSILFNSCSEYQKVLKSTDLDFKYNGTTVFKLASTGAVTSANEITAFGAT